MDVGCAGSALAPSTWITRSPSSSDVYGDLRSRSCANSQSSITSVAYIGPQEKCALTATVPGVYVVKSVWLSRARGRWGWLPVSVLQGVGGQRGCCGAGRSRSRLRDTRLQSKVRQLDM